MSTRAANTASTLTENIKSDFDAAKETVGRVRSSAKETMDAASGTAAAAPEKTRRVIGDNAALIGGLGVAIGAIIAAALPKTEAEAKIMGRPSDRVKQSANEAAQSGLAAAKEKAMAAADAATESVAEARISVHMPVA